MAITHTSRTGKTYYLHTGPKRGGGQQYFFSSKSDGSLADHLPEGFEVYEAVDGKVYLRRAVPQLIRDDERDCIARRVAKSRTGSLYKLEVHGEILTVHESSADPGGWESLGWALPSGRQQELRERFAHYQAVLRFILVDPERRLFAPERFCFRGSVDDWIPIGRPESIEKLAAKYLKHLGKDSMFELY